MLAGVVKLMSSMECMTFVASFKDDEYRQREFQNHSGLSKLPAIN